MTIALLGLPGTGKSTLVAAIYAACFQPASGMKITRMTGSDREYVNQISSRLDDCRPVGRTQMASPGWMSLPVELDGLDGEYRLDIPDLSGEHTQMAADQRLFNAEFSDMVNEATSLALCIRSDDLIDIPMLDDINRETGTPDEPATAAEQFTVKMSESPTQVYAVDLLHEVSRIVAKQLPLSVLFTAWDAQVVGSRPDTPATFLAQRLPLLNQYLQHRAGSTQLWGISAQGGDFNDPEQSEQLRNKPAAERSVAWDGEGTRHTFLSFTRWLITQA